MGTAAENIGGRFAIRRHAGAGGMGEVFEAIDAATGDPVALKILRSASPEDHARFEREARMLAQIRHPAVVRYLAHGVSAAGEPYLAMEWLEGEDLRALLRRRPRLDLDEALMIARRAAGALAEVHRRGAVHRDVKPSNLFVVVGAIEDIKLLDFGIAWAPALTRMTRTGMVVGTPGYMAPEQARGDRRLTPAADIFALGAVLYEILAGAPAFQAGNVMALLTKLVFDDPPRLGELSPGVPRALEALVHRMLAKDPRARPRDGAALLAELDGLGALGTGAAAPADPGPAPAGPPDAHGVTVALGPRREGEGARREGETSASPGALGAVEQRAVSVVLVGRPPEPAAAQPDATTRVSGALLPEVEEARRAADEAGASFALLGDGSMAIALAGAGVAKDRAASAARLALEIQGLVAGRPIALATGRGAIEGTLFLGEAIDRAAARVQQAAAAAGSAAPAAEAAGSAAPVAPVAPVAIDEITAALLDPRFVVRDGEAGPELVGEREHADAARALLGRPTPCVGREREIAALEGAFEACAAEPGAHACVVVAPAGAGKSRLAHELLRSLRGRARPPAVWIGRGDSLRAGSPLGMLGQALRGAAGVLGGEPLAERQQKLGAFLERLVAPPDRARLAEFLGEIAGAPLPDGDRSALRAARADAPFMAEQMQRAFQDLVRAACAAGPLVLLLEDLQWGDAATVRFVDAALGAARGAPFFVLALARPEIRGLFPDLWAGRGAEEISLKPLSARASERLAREVLGEAADPAVVARIVGQAEGNAFYLEEMIRAASAGQRALPETVVAMVQSRIDALDAEARRVLRAASVFGEVFWESGLERLLGGDAGATRAGRAGSLVARLCDEAWLLRRPASRFPGEEELAFRHALIREGAYAMLTDADRALGHRLAGAWLEARGEADPLLLAEHMERGGEPARAARHYLAAAEQAVRSGDAAAGVRHAERGLAATREPGERSALLAILCFAHMWRNELAAAVRFGDEVIRAAPPGSAPWLQGVIARVSFLAYTGDTAGILALAEPLLDVDPTPETAVLLVFALACCVLIVDAAGRLDVAARLGARMDAVSARFGERYPDVPAWVAGNRAYHLLLAAEDPCAALALFGVAERLCRETGNHRLLLLLAVGQGMAHWGLGEPEEVERDLRALVEVHAELGLLSAYPLFVRAGARADRGALAEARGDALRLIDSARARRILFDEGLGRWALASVLLREGRLAEAEPEIARARAILAAAPAHEPGVLATLAAVRLAGGRVDDALAAAREGSARYGALRAASFLRGAAVHLVHAECLHAAGLGAEAREAIAAARDRLLTMAATLPDPARRRSFLEQVPENARTLALARAWLGSPLPAGG